MKIVLVFFVLVFAVSSFAGNKDLYLSSFQSIVLKDLVAGKIFSTGATFTGFMITEESKRKFAFTIPKLASEEERQKLHQAFEHYNSRKFNMREKAVVRDWLSQLKFIELTPDASDLPMIEKEIFKFKLGYQIRGYLPAVFVLYFASDAVVRILNMAEGKDEGIW